MRIALIAVGVGILALALVAGGIVLGGALVRGRAAPDVACRTAAGWQPVHRGLGGGGWAGRSTMGGSAQGMPCFGAGVLPALGQTISMEQAAAAVERYLDRAGYTGLEIDEIIEFEANFYALVREAGTGTGAMELLVDRSTGAVSPEMGPNMMWNARYGMMGRKPARGMMGGYGSSGEMTLSADQAQQAAQAWLDKNLPGREAGEADAFYGYYTFHFLKDGVVDGMLSVNGSSGDVWYHSWHGAFIRMAQGTDL